MFEVAYHLKLPLYKLMEEMPHDELLGWLHYFERRPVGWRDDIRTGYLLQAQGDKRKVSDIFPALKNVLERNPSSAVATLKGSFMLSKMLTAVGGDKLEL